MIGEKRIFGIIAMILGLVAGVLILLGASGGRAVDLLEVLVGLVVLYGSYLIYRGKTGFLFGWAKTRLGAMINLAVGVITLIVPGGVGGTPAILAIVSGILGFIAA